MYSIRLQGDTAALLRKMRRYSELDRKGLNIALAEGVRESTLERFEQGRGPDGKRAKNLRFQVGGQWISKKKVKVNIPARPFLGLSDEDMQEIKATTEEFIGRDD